MLFYLENYVYYGILYPINENKKQKSELMKKLFFMLIIMSNMILTSCSAFDSDPIEPKIIGTGNLHYELKSRTWFVVIDSTQYTVANVTIPDHNPRSYAKTQSVEPVEGMLVTVFTSPREIGVQAVTGKQSAEQIEELYHTDSTIVVILCGILLLCVIGMALHRKQKSPWGKCLV